MSYSSFGIDQGVVETSYHANNLPQTIPNEWIPPPASLTTTDYDGLDLNDEIFLNNQLQGQNRPDSDIPLSPVAMAHANYNSLQNSWNLPVMQHALPFRLDLNSHYSHRRRFSLAVEHLNRMLIQQQSGGQNGQNGQVPAAFAYRSEPGLISGPSSAASESHRSLTSSHTNTEIHRQNGAKEERTVNPRELFGSVAQNSQMLAPARYILPLLMLSPLLGTIFKGMNEIPEKSTLFASFDSQNGNSALQLPEEPFNPMFIMNDECVSAITYWLNNTANIIPEKEDLDASRNTRPGWRRNNSIQVLPGRSSDNSRSNSVAGVSSSGVRKRRQKSFNNAVPDIFHTEMASEPVSAASDVPRDLSGFSDNQMPMISPQELALFTQGLELVPGLGQDVVPEVSVPKDLANVGNFEQAHEEPQLPSLPGNQEQELQEAPVASKPVNRGAGADSADYEPKPFPCPECDKQFKRLEHLKRHIRSVHSNIRPFHCKYCEKKFSRSDNLAQHLKTHFKVNSDGTTTIVYGNPNPHNRNRKRSVLMADSMDA